MILNYFHCWLGVFHSFITFSITCLPPRIPPPPSSVRWRWPPASWGRTSGCSRTPSESGQRSAPGHSSPSLYLPHTPEEDIEELDRGPELAVFWSSSEEASKLVAVTKVIIPMVIAKLPERFNIHHSENYHYIFYDQVNNLEGANYIKQVLFSWIEIWRTVHSSRFSCTQFYQ